MAAGSLSGLSLLIDTSKSRRLMIALYLSTRTCHFVCTWIWRHFIEKRVIRAVAELDRLASIDTDDSDDALYIKSGKSKLTPDITTPVLEKSELVQKVNNCFYQIIIMYFRSVGIYVKLPPF